MSDPGFDLSDTTLAINDEPAEVAHDFIPTLDADKPVATYRDWDPANTKIIQCRIANDEYPGDRYETRDLAISETTKKHGKILEANFVPGRAFLRVRR